MDKRYEQYCLASPYFYDSPYRGHTLAEGFGRALTEGFPVSRQPLPAGWRRERLGDWLINIPPGTPIPPQGWKIHVSACLDNVDEILTTVWQYCVPGEISFKFLSSRLAVFMRNAKYASRGASGKAVTIYPPDEASCERILRELDEVLGGAPGPYILSDLRYGDGPLYVRYGGFTERYCLGLRGELVPAIETAAGELVPDLRSPVFTVPPWVPLPGFLVPHLAARNSMTITGLPYDIEHPLHFSNGGGVYVGVDKRTGERVILKEARPHAGLAADASDAVARLRREHDMLQRLSGLGLVPEVRGYFEIGEHHFLVEELIEGQPLNSCYADRYPLTAAESDPATIAAYTTWALRICAEVERAADALHERGVIFNDMHMFNIMIRPDDTVAIIDFEAASHISEGRRRTVGNPGFAAPRDRAGFDIDAYSTACIRLAMFMPLTTLFALDRSKAAQVAAVIAEHFPVPAEFLDQAVREIAGRARTTRPAKGAADGETTARSEYECFYDGGDQAWSQLRAALTGAIRSSATPSRDDRLFPGDIEQFAAPGAGLAIAHGAAGVLYALSEAAGVRVPEYEEWLIARAANPVEGSRLGLYDGLAGVAWTLSRLGHADAALRAAEVCLGDRWERLGSDLYGGLAGFSLTMLDLGDSDAEPSLVDAGLKAAEIVADRPLGRGNDRDRAAGLLRGASGQALLFVRLYERTADPAYLDAAEAAIAADLDRCVTDRKGSLQVDDGWRVLPYVGAGSAGIGMVIDRFGEHRPTAACVEAAAKIRIAAQSAFYAQAGLFNGRAGMILYLAGHNQRGKHVVAQVRRLAWHAVRHAGGLAFPGDMLLRLSMDLGTGTAGVLLGLAAALAPEGAAMPFLGPLMSLPGRSVQGAQMEQVARGR
jgi:tRNA A-37 threonylcarbamoyl transferase component Bud32